MATSVISVDEALGRMLAAVEPVPAEQVAISQACGRALAEDVVARVTKPPADVSAMDGYALRAGDAAEAPARLAVVGEAPAGRAHDRPLGPGQAVRIFTGGPLPEGADAIVPQEHASRRGDRVTIERPAVAGRHVRRRGLDFRAGDAGPRAGTLLGPREIALIAAMDLPWTMVRRRPRVALLSTGDELVMPGERPSADQIVCSNSLALGALVRLAGGEPLDLGIADDDEAALRQRAAAAAGADLMVVTGGMSVGDRDLVRRVLAARGLDLDFWKIAMRPGKPLGFGRLGGMPVLGLPGNPVSTLVCGRIFLGPMLNRMLGLEESEEAEAARLGRGLPANDGRQDYLRARVERDAGGRPVATPFETQDSSMLAVLARADGLIVRPPHAPAVEAGATVPLLRL